jgi:hypothetical protein
MSPSPRPCIWKMQAACTRKGTLQQEDIPLNYMILSDSLEMVGVELKSSWVQSRKVNGDAIQVWFKCHTVDIRFLDSSNISSKVRSWLFQDQLEKPQAMILYRLIQMGGLGLHNVKYKALASLIRTFLETSVHPSFQHSLLHSLLYRKYVFEDDSLYTPPTMPPYYSVSFFQTIQNAKENTPLNVTTMTTAQLYRYIIEEELTMTMLESNTMGYIKSRVELSVPSSARTEPADEQGWRVWGLLQLAFCGNLYTNFSQLRTG